MSIAGYAPRSLGFLKDVPTDEMMFWMYCPIADIDGPVMLPDNLEKYRALVYRVLGDDPHRFNDRYIYLTVKTLYVSGSNNGQRPGWHIDGYGTDDLNYIWYDREPTEFFVCEPVTLSDDCDVSLVEMDELFRHRQRQLSSIVTFSPGQLLRLDNTVIHRVKPDMEPGMRTFIKVSVSKERYNLVGNSINHRLPYLSSHLAQRDDKRNHPHKE